MSARANWSGQLAFILAASASAVGLGNLWRFPYLAAQYGGGMFIAIYLGLVVTLGFTLMLTEIAIGRKTGQSQITAYSRLKKGWGPFGIVATVIPLLIMPYYCVIGGWVLYYLKTYFSMALTGSEPMGAVAASSDAFFDSFVSSPYSPFICAVIFLSACACVVLFGVKRGIERSNTVLMPVLFAMAIAISVYVMTLPGALAGVKYYLMPNVDSLRVDGSFSLAKLGKTVLGAMGQMFYSLSLSMGIMITYGSYMRKSDSIERSVRRIEIFDTVIAVVAGLMIIPVVYVFALKTGVTPELVARHAGDVAAATDEAVHAAMNTGPGLMFKTLPKVFAAFGGAGSYFAFAFFLLVTFAAATSAISLFEACVASVCDLTSLRRVPAALLTGGFIAVLAAFPAFGYGLLGGIEFFGMKCLDFFDFITNSVMMPVTAAVTCLFVGFVIKPSVIIEEVEADSCVFRSKRFYSVMVRYFAPALVTAILVSEVCRAFGIGGWSI